MATEKVVRQNVAKKTGISSDSVPSRLPQRHFFTASKAPEQVQTERSKPVFRKQTGAIRKTIAACLIGLTLASTVPQFAYAGRQDEKSKIVKNELTLPGSVAPETTTRVELNVFPKIGGTTFLLGGAKDGKLNDSNPIEVDAMVDLKGLGLDAFTPGSAAIYFPGVYGTGAFANFWILIPDAPGVINIKLLSIDQTGKTTYSHGTISFLDPPDELIKVGILPSSKPGKDYTVELSYDEKEKTAYFDFKIGTKYVISYKINLLTEKVYRISIPDESVSPIGQN